MKTVHDVMLPFLIYRQQYCANYQIQFVAYSYFFLIQIYNVTSIAYIFSVVRYIQIEDYNLYINTKNLGTIYFLGKGHSQVPEKRKIGSFSACLHMFLSLKIFYANFP